MCIYVSVKSTCKTIKKKIAHRLSFSFLFFCLLLFFCFPFHRTYFFFSFSLFFLNLSFYLSSLFCRGYLRKCRGSEKKKSSKAKGKAIASLNEMHLALLQFLLPTSTPFSLIMVRESEGKSGAVGVFFFFFFFSFLLFLLQSRKGTTG